MDLPAIQAALRQAQIPAWLFLDFRRRDPFAYDILGLPAGTPSRRWAYLIPADGPPRKLLHRIEPANLAGLPGEAVWYSTWAELAAGLQQLLRGIPRVAMQYSPANGLPYLSTVDAGTVELVRAAGAEVVSSGPLVARFQGLLTAHQIETHARAAPLVHRAKDDAFTLIRDRARSGHPITEREVADFIERRFADLGLRPEGHGPNVSANANAANPHYDPPATGSTPITPGSAVLIDLWAKLKGDPAAVVYDITWCAWLGSDQQPSPPEAYADMFGTAVRARDAAADIIRRRCQAGQTVLGCEADDACQEVLQASPYAAGIWHRTGHAIDTRTHGSGTNLDNFETRDDRPLLPGACFSIEPGLYLPPWGVRTEINMVIELTGQPTTFGPSQASLLLL